MASLSILKRTGKRGYRRIGRGQSSTRGKTAGRGTKGQNARAGRKKRPELRDIIKKLPKRRGYGKNRGRTVYTTRPRPAAVSLSHIEKMFDAGTEITPTLLVERHVIARHSGRIPAAYKLVGNEISKQYSFIGARASASAKAAVEKAGGSIA